MGDDQGEIVRLMEVRFKCLLKAHSAFLLSDAAVGISLGNKLHMIGALL